MRPRLIQVAGLAWSGTTMLGAMIGSHPESFYLGEAAALYRPTRRHHFDPVPVCGERPCPYWKQIELLTGRDLHAGTCETLGCDSVVDSSGSLAWIYDSRRSAEQGGLETVSLAIWKDPKSLAFSHWRRGEPALQWRDWFVTYHKRLLGFLPNVGTVSYQRLTEDPPRVLESVCHLAGLEYQPAQEEFWRSDQHFLFGSGSVHKSLKTGQGSIAPTEFQPGFEAVWEGLRRQVEFDTELLQVLSTLESLDVFAGEAGRSPLHRSHRSRPYWYFKERVINGYFTLRPRTFRLSGWRHHQG